MPDSARRKFHVDVRVDPAAVYELWRGSFTQPLDSNKSTVAFHDAEVVESPRPVPYDFLSTEKRIENLIDRCSWHSHASVADAQDNELSGFCVGCHRGVMLIDVEVFGPYDKRTAVGHGVARVHRKIKQRLVKLGRIAFD